MPIYVAKLSHELWNLNKYYDQNMQQKFVKLSSFNKEPNFEIR